jgi:hypothetical protein
MNENDKLKLSATKVAAISIDGLEEAFFDLKDQAEAEALVKSLLSSISEVLRTLDADCGLRSLALSLRQYSDWMIPGRRSSALIYRLEKGAGFPGILGEGDDC